VKIWSGYHNLAKLPVKGNLFQVALMLSTRLPRRWLDQIAKLWLRPLVIVGVLLASARWAPRASQRHLALLVGAGMALVFLRWPPLGLATLIAASLIVPFAIGTGTQTSLNVTVLLLPLLIGLWLFDMVAHQRQVRLLPSRPAWPLLALVLVATLAFISGQLPWLAFAQTAPLRAQAGGLAVFLLSAGAFLLVAHQVRDLRWLQRLTWLFLALGGLHVAARLLPSPGRFVLRLFPPGATGGLFWTWLVALAFSQAAFNRRLHLRWRLALGGLVLATFYANLFQAQSWASGWLPPLVAVLATLWAGAPRLGLLTTLAAGVLAARNTQEVINLIMINEEYSLVTRLEAWRILAEILKVNPILGLGPANYYWYTSLYPLLGWYVKFNSHNQYVDIIAQTGLLGLACFLWFAWEVGRLGWRLRARVPAGFAQAYVYGALGGLAGTLAAGMLADWVLPFVYNVGLDGFRASVLGWLFLGGLVSLEQITRQAEQGIG
jgi:hypothetical protein